MEANNVHLPPIEINNYVHVTGSGSTGTPPYDSMTRR